MRCNPCQRFFLSIPTDCPGVLSYPLYLLAFLSQNESPYCCFLRGIFWIYGGQNRENIDTPNREALIQDLTKIYRPLHDTLHAKASSAETETGCSIQESNSCDTFQMEQPYQIDHSGKLLVVLFLAARAFRTSDSICWSTISLCSIKWETSDLKFSYFSMSR